jgi:ArsR family transcriptional regulator
MTPHEVFGLLSDETRLRCLLLLENEKELCVCEIGQVLGSLQSRISRHLALMRLSGLVLDDRRGQWVYYRLNQVIPEWTRQILRAALEALRNTEPYCFDLEKLYEFRKKNICVTDS